MEVNDLVEAASTYIRVNARRHKAEGDEAEARRVLEGLLAAFGLTEVITARGTVRYQDVAAVEYDYRELAPLLPPALLGLVSRMTVSTRALEDLISQGSVGAEHVAPARRVRSTRRLVVAKNKRMPSRTASRDDPPVGGGLGMD